MLKRVTLIVFIVAFSLPAQTRDYEGYIGGFFMLVDALDATKGYCFDLERFGHHTGTDAPVIVHACKAGLWKDGTWMVDYPEAGKIYAPAFSLCAAAESLTENADLILEECSDNPLQSFVFGDDGKVRLESDPEYCLAAGETSTGSGAGIRRGTRFGMCDGLADKFTTWVVPREDAIYPPNSYTLPAAVTPTESEEPVAAANSSAPSVESNAAIRGPGGGGDGHQYLRACAPCHAENGAGYQSEHSPKLSGLADWYLIRQMWNYKNALRGHHEGERWATQMSYHVEGFDEAQIESYVEFIVALEDVPAEPTITGDTIRGKALYDETCVACHGADAMGITQLNAPRLAGMSDWYMVKQLEKFRDGMRGDHPDDVMGAQMVPFVRMLPDERALIDVISYINTLANE